MPYLRRRVQKLENDHGVDMEKDLEKIVDQIPAVPTYDV